MTAGRKNPSQFISAASASEQRARYFAAADVSDSSMSFQELPSNFAMSEGNAPHASAKLRNTDDINRRIGVGTDRSQFATMAQAAKAALRSDNLDVVADRGYFPAGDRDPLASCRFPSVLALEIKTARRPAEDPAGDPSSRSRDESRQPIMGRTTDPWRASQARHRCWANHRCKVYGEGKATAVPRVEDISS